MDERDASGLTRLVADLRREDAELLAALAERGQQNRATTLARALALLDRLTLLDEAGGMVLLVQADGSRERLSLP